MALGSGAHVDVRLHEAAEVVQRVEGSQQLRWREGEVELSGGSARAGVLSSMAACSYMVHARHNIKHMKFMLGVEGPVCKMKVYIKKNSTCSP